MRRERWAHRPGRAATAKAEALATSLTVREQVVLPATVDEAWAFLADTPRMVALDPLLVAYEPERGVIEEGTLNRVTTRIGPLRTTMTSRTEVLDPPSRVVFASVRPSRPVHVRTEDTLEPLGQGCPYVVTATLTPTVPVVGQLAARLMARAMARSRRELMQRLRSAIAEADPGA